MTALDGRIMVAHNARFEQFFLIGNCEGYAEALRDGRIRIIDSMKVAASQRGRTRAGFQARRLRAAQPRVGRRPGHAGTGP